jgi:BMFP domain-containing protein YqiC
MTPQQIQTLQSENTALRRELDMLRASYDSARQTNEVLKAKCARIEARFISENNACQPKSCGIVPKT